MPKPKVSVIIPVYNTDKFLEVAFSSIQNQTLKDIEIIVVNDGSTDRSQEIIESLAKTDQRIKYFSQLNSGQSVARNNGMDNASGDFIYFMDSDDLLEIDALEMCYNKCISENLDLVTFDSEIFSDGNESVGWGYNYFRAGKIEEKVYSGVEMMEALLKKNIFRAAPWLIFVKRSLLQELKLKFFPGIIHEDELFTPILYLAAARIGYIPRNFFHRRIRANSTMTNNFSKKNLRGYFTVVEQLTLFAADKEKRVKVIVDRLIKDIANAVAYNAGTMSIVDRAGVLRYFFGKGLIKTLTKKNLTILIFPFAIKIKSLLLQKNRKSPN
jgi:glycosyltransferase involved in cell wall biosynthesis